MEFHFIRGSMIDGKTGGYRSEWQRTLSWFAVFAFQSRPGLKSNLSLRPGRRMLKTGLLMDTLNTPTRPPRPSRLKGAHKGKGRGRPLTAATELNKTPAPILLVDLPGILSHPPDHPNHITALKASLDALQQCLAIHSNLGSDGSGSLSLEQEMRAYGMMSEIGMKVLAAGLGGQDGPDWAKGVESEIDNAINEGTRLCQQIASLRPHKPYFTLMRAHLLMWQHQFKTCRALLKREIGNFTSSDSPATVYTCYFTYLSALLASSLTQPADTSNALQALTKLQNIATSREDNDIAALCLATRLQILMRAGFWDLVGEACEAAEAAAGLKFYADAAANSSSTLGTPEHLVNAQPSSSTTLDNPTTSKPLQISTKLQVLILSVIYYTYMSQPKVASPRLTFLHQLLDSDALGTFPDGCIDVTLSSGPTMLIRVTHPRVLYETAFLISGLSKRDVAGRKPRCRVFIQEGLGVADEVDKMVPFPLNGSIRDVQEVDERLNKIKADMLCQLASIHIMRSEFNEAEDALTNLIAHARTTGLFRSFASRIVLIQAHLAHALGKADRALQCYQSAGFLERSGGGSSSSFIVLSARIGEVILRLSSQGQPINNRADEAELKAMSLEVVGECRRGGPPFEAVTRILEAVWATGIVDVKNKLKAAIESTSRCQDNHLRALILALMSNMYLLTASDHAQVMLKTCQQLAIGLGAPLNNEDELANGGTVVGNAPLGLWVGEKFVELYRRNGQDEKAERQMQINLGLREAMDRLLGRDTGDTSTETAAENDDGMEVEVGGVSQKHQQKVDIAEQMMMDTS
ncbi:hypothetical protein FRB98_009071 [Tulasnella sp. 332]|nr:hypothetical protein FRB98_009071 [Tulasnella sp. 332]